MFQSIFVFLAKKVFASVLDAAQKKVEETQQFIQQAEIGWDNAEGRVIEAERRFREALRNRNVALANADRIRRQLYATFRELEETQREHVLQREDESKQWAALEQQYKEQIQAEKQARRNGKAKLVGMKRKLQEMLQAEETDNVNSESDSVHSEHSSVHTERLSEQGSVRTVSMHTVRMDSPLPSYSTASESSAEHLHFRREGALSPQF